MTRRVFFSFHYENDSMRAAQVRNSNVITSNSIDAHGFIDAAQWEEVKKGDEDSIKKWINNQLEGTSVTVVLIGSQTVEQNSVRKWIKFEIDRSMNRGSGLIGIYIHGCNDPRNGTDTKGQNPFDRLVFNGTHKKLSEKYRVYDWINDDGRNNLGTWIQQAALDAGK